MSAREAAPQPELRDERIAASPPEARGLERDEVRLLVASPEGITHTRFTRLHQHLAPGDLLIVNTSPTMPAALDATRGDAPIVVHLSTWHSDGEWSVELRRADLEGPVLDAHLGERIRLPRGGLLTLRGPDAGERRRDGVRIWRARLEAPSPLPRYLAGHGRPIRYAYLSKEWPLSAYQTVFATPDPSGLGSAEMASAARPFSRRVVRAIRRRGVRIATVTLHTGTSSLEDFESPRPEWFDVPGSTSRAIDGARRRGSRVIAVGTTVTRALETVGRANGTVTPGSGWTNLVLGPGRPAGVVDGIITGWHERAASHLSLLRAVAGEALVEVAYEAGRASGYLLHEFGDSCLLLRER